MLLLITSATIYEESKENCISIKTDQRTYRYYNKRVVITLTYKTVWGTGQLDKINITYIYL